MRPFVPMRFRNGAVLLQGPTFDFEKVLAAHDAFIGRLARRFMVEAKVTPDPNQPERRRNWPDPGNAEAQSWWRKQQQKYDAAPLTLIYDVGPVSVSSYLLGETACVYSTLNGTLSGMKDEKFEDLDFGPHVLVYGRRIGIVRKGLLDTAGLDAVADALVPLGGSAPLTMHRLLLDRRPGAPEKKWVACVCFPYASFGGGEGIVRVRCKLPGGGEVPDTSEIKPN